MKRKLLAFLFLMAALFAGGRERDEPILVFKGYPANYILTKLPHYYGETRFGFEIGIAKHQSLELGISAIMPNPVSLLVSVVSSSGDQGSESYIFFGGRGMLTYRYYFLDDDVHFEGPYIGPELSVTGLQSLRRVDRWGSYNYGYYGFDRSQTKAIMVNANVTAGYQFVITKISKRTNRERVIALNLGLSVGYRYYYFWRHYDKGNVEYTQEGAYTSNIYRWYKKVPIGAWINFSLGGIF